MRLPWEPSGRTIRLYSNGEAFCIGRSKHGSNLRAPRMAYIRAGSFPAAGSQLFGEKKALAAEVFITRPFYIGVNKVTVGDFRYFLSDAHYSIVGNDAEKLINILKKGKPDQSLSCVNFSEALAYVNWISKRTGAKYFIPSSAQWEFVARMSRELCWEGLYPKRLFRDNFEWTSTKYGDFDPIDIKDPKGPLHGGEMEIRGSLRSVAAEDDLCATDRHGFLPDDRAEFIGFRIARKAEF